MKPENIYLVELNELFKLYWRRIIHIGQTSSMAGFQEVHA